MSPFTFSEIELALTAAALNGDAGSLYRLATGLMDEGTPFDSVLFDYLIPAERELGRRWQEGDYLVADEHAATATIETLISLLSGMLDQPTDGIRVVVATAEGDEHSLPARAASAYLLFLGYRTTYLGANVPGADLREFLEPDPPEALVLSCAMTSHLLGARSVIASAHDVGVPVVVGGRAFGLDGRWAPAVGADVWVPSPRDLVEVLDRWADADEVSLQETPQLTEDLVGVIADRSDIIAKAEAALGQTEGPTMQSSIRDDLRILQGTVEASMLVGDEEILIEMIQWLRSRSDGPGTDGDALPRALLEALQTTTVRAGDVLDSALRNAGPSWSSKDGLTNE
jgi:methanogenic corrinoid protein MtbC1